MEEIKIKNVSMESITTKLTLYFFQFISTSEEDPFHDSDNTKDSLYEPSDEEVRNSFNILQSFNFLKLIF